MAGLLLSTPPLVPDVLSDLVFHLLACLQHQLKLFLGRSHLVCVLEVAGVFSLYRARKTGMCVIGSMLHNERTKSSLARPKVTTFVRGKRLRSRGRRTDIIVIEELMMLGEWTRLFPSVCFSFELGLWSSDVH